VQVAVVAVADEDFGHGAGDGLEAWVYCNAVRKLGALGPLDESRVRG
jgi:hypothetical protein